MLKIKRKLLVPKNDKYPYPEAMIDYAIDYSFKFVAYEPTSWTSDTYDVTEKNFFASGRVKWDACSHINFYGQDHPNDGGSYYHICGGYNYISHILTMNFILEVAMSEMEKDDKYTDMSELYELRKLKLLDDYEIVDGKIEEWELDDIEKMMK